MSTAAAIRIDRQDAQDIDPQKLMQGFFSIAALWGLDNRQMRRLLGEPAERTFQRWKGGHVNALPADTVRRIGYLAGIYKALQILYSNPQQADEWLKRSNADFGEQRPLDRMLGGDVTDLAAVRSYLDAARAPW